MDPEATEEAEREESQPPEHSTTQDGDPNKVKRVNKACLHCRKRKSRCHLDANGQVPCIRCKREGLDCILGGSNRGGRRVRRKTTTDATQLLPTSNAYNADEASNSFQGLGTVGTVNSWGQPPPSQSPTQIRTPLPQLTSNEPRPYGDLRPPETERSSRSLSAENSIQFSNLQNPSDALGILAQVAEGSTAEDGLHHNGHHGVRNPHARLPPPPITSGQSIGMSYPPIDQGQLSISTVEWLLRRYYDNYHPYYPLVPAETFVSSRLARVAAQEPHLLTAILVIASKDIREQPEIYEVCASYMKSLVSDLAAGGNGGLEAVEALLILAEWAPYTQRSKSGRVGRGEEDKESWMHVGIALRISYFLGLDKFSFRFIDDGKDPYFYRKRLIWTCCYMQDRSISIRVGKAFWSRGPGPLTSLRREDFTTLIPKSPNEVDYASLFQANLELTTLFSNVHDVLYSNPGSSFRSHLNGGYIVFIDSFRQAIYSWKSVWGTLTGLPQLKAVLMMSYDYLRLYTNAFAFQATIRRALPPKSPIPKPNGLEAPTRVFYGNVGAVGDVRFIYEGLDSAKAILDKVANYVDPESHLRFMPLRIYLYIVYASVFLYRARCVGVIGAEEDRNIRSMIQETVTRLERASTGPLHPGSRYSQLVRLLWQKVSKNDKPRPLHIPNPNTMIGRPGDAPLIEERGTDGTGSLVGTSPAGTEQMGDFAWTDLMAVGDFAVNGASSSNANGLGGAAGASDEAFWQGFLPMDVSGGFDMGGLEGGDLSLGY